MKATQIKNHMWIFVNALIENPTFDSQTKETLTLPTSKFGTKPVFSEEFMKKGKYTIPLPIKLFIHVLTVHKSAICDQVLSWAKFKADQQIKRTDGTKRTRFVPFFRLAARIIDACCWQFDWSTQAC